MIELTQAEVTWALNSYCTLQCEYCRPEWKSGTIDHSIGEYLSIVEKLQTTRYKHHQTIYWRITGGEPLNFPDIGTLLKKIKEKSSIVELETSGEMDWFSFLRVSKLIDKLHLTYHHWQNDDIVNFILEQCSENNVSVSISIPLESGLIFECREKVSQFIQQGYNCREQVLLDAGGGFYKGYSQVDLNRIHGRDDSWEPEPVVFNPNVPIPGYIDLSVVTNKEFVYTGNPCYAGVDWLSINPKGFVTYSQCGGRNEPLNVFDPNWMPPDSAFPCTVNQCRSEQDQNKIRIHTA